MSKNKRRKANRPVPPRPASPPAATPTPTPTPAAASSPETEPLAGFEELRRRALASAAARGVQLPQITAPDTYELGEDFGFTPALVFRRLPVIKLQHLAEGLPADSLGLPILREMLSEPDYERLIAALAGYEELEGLMILAELSAQVLQHFYGAYVASPLASAGSSTSFVPPA